ncbi:hypothetical protein HK100_003447 [Physocladia obscura]|uniref:Helicase ATP-binding domain-containing protein n=1 Tax=Physocladia obscura TaxID=109957 RepID=A0AAD5XDJ5_9FUNG|nr:hypothetical protein HK100_003447 [Physocladia obscura]
MFVVDGDALVEHIINKVVKLNSKSKENKNTTAVTYIAPVVFIYLLEIFLTQLSNAGGRFDIIFFGLESICSFRHQFMSENNSLVRRILKAHLQHMPKITVRSFNVLSDTGNLDIVEFVKTSRPAFVLTDDMRSLIVAKFLAVKTPVAFFANDIFASNSKILVAFVCVPPDTLTLAAEQHLAAHAEYFTKLVQLFSFHEQQQQQQQISEASLSLLPIQSYLLSARDVLATQTILKILKSSKATEKISNVFCFLLHIAALPFIPLSERVFSNTIVAPQILEFLSELYTSARFAFESIDWNHTTREFADLIDPRLFVYLTENTEFASKCLQTTAVATRMESLCRTCNILQRLPDFVAKWSSTASQSPLQPQQQQQVQEKSVALLAYSNPLLNDKLPKISNTSRAEPENFGFGTIAHYETQHWHSRSPLGNIKSSSSALDKGKKGRFSQKGKQVHAHWISVYAASLTGAKGGILVRRVITVNNSKCITAAQSDPTANKTDWSGHQKSGSKKQSKKDAIKEQNTLSKNDGKETAARTRMQTIFVEAEIGTVFRCTKKSLEVLTDTLISMMVADRKAQLSKIEAKIPDFMKLYGDITIVVREIQVMKLRLAMEGYFLACACRDDDSKMSFATVTFLCATALISSMHQNCASLRGSITDDYTVIAEICGLALEVLGLVSVIEKELEVLLTATVTKKEYELPFKIKMPKFSVKKTVGCSPAEFQLRYCGYDMERTLDSKPDPRVDFEPDGWQRQILDCIDKQESVLVVAPTSAGKTFCSFYAMEQVLRLGDDGVIVYIAPTKALVNQVAAEVEARFSKNYSYPGKSVWAILTRDYRIHSPLHCQILVTVPAMLQIMLLQSNVAGSWIPRIKRVIFDEIHCIGELDGGVVWEQLLLMVPCPILALSATVGNVDELGHWLANIQSSQGNTMKIIRHKTRYSDLRKYMYLPRLSKTGEIQTESLMSMEPFKHVHPFSALMYGSATIVDDLELEPVDMIPVSDLMVKYSSPRYPAPTPYGKFFGDDSVIKRRDTQRYSDHLKEILSKWMDQVDHRDPSSPFFKLISQLAGALPNEMEKFDKSLAIPSSNDQEYWLAGIPTLVKDMDVNGLLPGLFFCYSRDMNNLLLKSVLKTLETAEVNFKTTDAAHLRKVEQWKKQKEQATNDAKFQEKENKAAAAGKRGKGKEKDDKDDDSIQYNPQKDTFDPDAPLDQYSYANKKCGLTMKDIEEEISGLFDIPDYYIEALKRGVCVHHAGMNRMYLQLVERWFRKGWLRVVFCTGTLALGINMPATSSIFVGDSVFLTALNFRQAAGRAGRRGFDVKGNVIFFGLALNKIYALLTSKLPNLRASFPISTTFVLRLHMLLTCKESQTVGSKMINSILSLNRFTTSSSEEPFKGEVAHFLRASIEYLRDSSFLTSNGTPINLAGLAAHLYFTEPSNFLFCKLVKSTVLFAICSNFNTSPKSTCETLVHVISSLFCRKRILPTVKALRHQENIKKSPSMVYLPPLPEHVQAAIEDEERRTVKIYTRYVTAYALSNRLPEDVRLPFSGLHVGAPSENSDGGNVAGADKNSTVINILRSQNQLQYPRHVARSAFIALLGVGDNFQTIQEMAETLRPGLVLETSTIPSFTEFIENDDDNNDSGTSTGSVVLNAFILDFYKHGQVQALDKDNMIRAGEIWTLLNDFWLVLKAIRASVEVLLLAARNVKMDNDDGVEKNDEDDDDDSLEANQRNFDSGSRVLGVGNGFWQDDVIFKTASGKRGVTVDGRMKPFESDAPGLWQLYCTLHMVQITFAEKFVKVFA